MTHLYRRSSRDNIHIVEYTWSWMSLKGDTGHRSSIILDSGPHNCVWPKIETILIPQERQMALQIMTAKWNNLNIYA